MTKSLLSDKEYIATLNDTTDSCLNPNLLDEKTDLIRAPAPTAVGQVIVAELEVFVSAGDLLFAVLALSHDDVLVASSTMPQFQLFLGRLQGSGTTRI
jgi:hypothetical protein